MAAAALLPLAISSFEERFAAEPISAEYDERAAFQRAAALMLSDHPMGAGANNYVVVANSRDYIRPGRGVTWGGSSRSTFVHNAYWLTAAELGYLGAIAFALLLLPLGSTSTAHRRRVANSE